MKEHSLFKRSILKGLILAVIISLVLVVPVMAQAVDPPAQPEESINQLLVAFLSLSGFGGLVAVLVNVGKTTGLVKDGKAPIFVTGLNLLGLVILFVVRLVAPEFDLGEVDALAGTFAQVLVVVLSFIVQLGSSKITHSILKGAPVIGKSHSVLDEHSIQSYG